jgi:thiol-disulfide isomerase/thioredoxin
MFIVACTQPNNTVRGHIEGISNDTVFVMKFSLDKFGEQELVKDTIFAKNGKFEYTFPNDGAYGLEFSFPQFYIRNRPTGGLYIHSRASLTIFAKPGDKVSFKGNTNSTGLCNISVLGSKLNQEFEPIQNKLFEIRTNEVEEEMALEQAMVDKNKENEYIGWAKRRERNNVSRELFSNYIKTNLDNPLSAFLLFRQPLDSVGMYYHKLGENARNSIFRNMLDGEMKRYFEYTNATKAKEEVVAGNNAPDFMLNDMEGKPFTLSSLRGKYVIIDFWGSWCVPCVLGIPKMKDVYKKYKDKLEILGIACNEQSVNIWRDAVMQHELPWINVYNDKLSSVNVMYGIMVYPTKIIIDPEGTILMREEGEGEYLYKKLESVIY